MKEIKKNKLYYILIRFLFIPIYDVFWEYIINFKDKLYKIFFCLNKRKVGFFNLKNNTKVLVKDNESFKKLAKQINLYLNESFIEKKTNYLKSEDYKRKLQQSRDNESHALNPFVLNIIDDLNHNIRNEILNFATSDMILKTVCKYLGVFPILAKIELNLNIPSNNNARSSQLWHRDDLGYKSLNLFLAINDINENNGPFITIKKKDPLNIFYRVEKEISTGLTGERGKILDSDFNYLINKNDYDNEVVKLEGSPGTGLFVDTVRNYHKGGHCKLKHRLILRLLYLTPDSLHSFEKENSERKKNVYSLKNKGFYKSYLFRQRNKLFHKLNFHKILFKFYLLVSIKK